MSALTRIGLIGRLMIIMMLALFAIIVAVLAIGHYERAATPPVSAVPFPRIEQAAGIIDLLRQADPSLRPMILHALNGLQLRAEILDRAPPESPDLRRAPRIEATLRAFMNGDAGDGLRAYTAVTAPMRAAATLNTEGPLVRIVWTTPDGRALVLRENLPPRRIDLRLLGLPAGFWIGILGLVVAGLALLTTRREMQPLQRLTAAALAFDGRQPTAPVEARGAPDLQRLANAVHLMQDRVARLLQERSFLIGAISHDLKTYLTRLRLRAEALADTDQHARMVGDLDAMTDLIETSLAFAQGTTVSQRMGRVDLADLAAIEAAERNALGQPVTLVGDDAPDAVVPGDPVALRRVVANLVDNACKFGRTRVEIAVETTPSLCRFMVDDDGPGVGAAERIAIFNAFYRVENSRNRRTGGTGLGLAIARQIVEAHGGTLAVSDSRLGGARFAVELRRAS